jgi:hypothetical protein
MVPAITIVNFFYQWDGFAKIIDSSIALSPSVIFPSTGIFSPGFTRNKSPLLMS